MRAWVVAVAALLVAWPSAAQLGGGEVTNTAPKATSITGSKVSVNPAPTELEMFSMSGGDGNGESDIAFVEVRFYHVATSTSTPQRVVVNPAPFVAPGWTVTDTVAGDGDLEWTYEHRWAGTDAAGGWQISFVVTDQAGLSHETVVRDETQLEGGAQVVAHPCTYDADGLPDGCRWGLWVATPGAVDVDSVNYLKAENTGAAAGSVAVSWTGTEFQTASAACAGSVCEVPIDGNFRFRHGVGAVPSSSTFTTEVTDPDGTATFTVPAGAILWIAYRIDFIPVAVASGEYTATYSFG
jgi:hypothetical protein